MKKIFVLLSVLALLCLTACNETKESSKAEASAQPKTLRLACMAYNEPEVQAGVKALEAMNYKVQVIVLQNATIMFEAIDNNEIDASLHAHKPWMDSYNKTKSKSITMLTPYIHKNVFGIFSSKHKNISEIKEGSSIAIPQDESNMSRSLFLLEELGFIKLKPGVTNPTDLDIESNIKQIEIIKLDTHQVISALQDVDAACSAKLFIVSNKVADFTELAQSSDLDKFGVGFTVSSANKDAPWTRDLIKAYTTEDVRNAINALYKGGSVAGF
ncbi:MetQ/NlpA family ABC transporter substrate-binding protein [Desulfovibrio sp. UIB00]|uniref:MetQ/NlpA family ABC transporter substrate-binding protein n=1 Tax=Desulfovibrio sp. UIB00 TaxID=2804314 RepID=UPI001F0F1D3D|nr:MetQ/NlpA family ABC transporter substrate-binding protein [Desulfovibrio sp. UIB00]MCH5143703.1 hypothetical protein [Desulfovibrio sp. UIB00]